ncbi:choice-of-anchor D domain-containing protein [Luteolibacter flavescens]|uniref:Choice-of-anchor D domain-containing protein n=1 Tax=Luteolibacter flavescens TaxID=1859460 RepID=A0ABT3FPN5_9BACT|nr:choice-of-anchor D domain-containing protein [Luteolibacter flavescens]MCW1885216.1 choice-of-anchor D domain-containing protein [Luteolibacter flavescens]
MISVRHLIQRSKIPLLRGAWLTLAMIAAGNPASGAVTSTAYYRMGEDNPSATPGQKVLSVGNRFRTNEASTSGGEATYTGDVAAEAVERVGSSMAVSFSPDSYLGVPAISTTDNFGLEAWVRPASSTAEGVVLHNGVSGTSGLGIAQVGNKFQARIGSSLFGSGPLSPGVWSHVALVRSSGVTTLYVDGVECGTSGLTPPSPGSWLYMGGSGFTGSLDEVRAFTFSAGAFVTDDLSRRAAQIALAEEGGDPVPNGRTYDFGVADPGSAVDRSFVITSSGVTSLSNITARVSGADAGCFTVTEAPDATVATGDTTTFAVRFSPVGTERRTALLTITSNDPDDSPYRVMITGTTSKREISVEAPAGNPLPMGSVLTWGLSSSTLLPPAGLSRVTSLALGGSHVLALRDDGSIVWWGSSLAKPPADLGPATAIATGSYHSLAVTSGKVVGWGLTPASWTPLPAGLDGVVAVAAGLDHSLALRSDGTVVGWGRNNAGQLNIPASLSNVVAIAAGDHHNLALKSDGTVVTWGRNQSSYLAVPANLSNVVAIAAGSTTSLALRADGTVVGWGMLNGNLLTIPANVTGVVSIAAHGNELRAMKNDGTVQALKPTYTPPTPNARGKSLAVNNFITGVILTPNLPFGNQTVSYPSAPKTVTVRNSGIEPLQVTGITLSGTNAADFALDLPALPLELAPSASVEIAATFTPSGLSYHQAVLQIASNDPDNGNLTIDLSGTGVPAAPEIAIFDTTGPDAIELVDYKGTQVFPETTVDGTATVKTFTIVNQGYLDLTGIAISKDGNHRGEFQYSEPEVTTLPPGASTTFTVSFNPKAGGARDAMLRVSSNDLNEGIFEILLTGNAVGSEITVESSGGESLESGQVKVWGQSNASGELTIPPGLTGVRRIAGGDGFFVASLHDGTVTCWGRGNEGQTSPPQDLDDVIDVAACFTTAFALKSDGTVVAWGSNQGGARDVPPGLTGVKKIVANGAHVMALKEDGTAVTWGQFSSWPVTPAPADLSGIVDIATSTNTAAVLKADGSVVVWGDDYNHVDQVPEGLTGITSIAVSDSVIAALKSDGTVVTWGGIYPNRSDYKPPYGLSGVVDIVAHYDSIMARKADGTLVMWRRHNDPVALPAGLSGITAMAAGYYDFAVISDSVADLGTRPVTIPGTPRSLVVRNTGTLPLDIHSVEIVDGDISDFEITSTLPTGPLAAGGQASFSVRFVPSATGRRVAKLRITSSDHDEGWFHILLTGHAVPHVPILSVEEPSGTAIVDGRVVEFGLVDRENATPMPEGLSGVKAIAAVASGTIALKKDGTVIGWGAGSVVRPPIPLTDVSSIVSGEYFAMALRHDGTVKSWADDLHVEPVPAGVGGIVQVAGAGDHVVALKSDGTVAAWDSKRDTSVLRIPEGLDNVVAVATGSDHGVALKSDGTVVTWATSPSIPPSARTGVVAIAAARYHTLALKSDGTVVGWGSSSSSSPVVTPPAGLSGVVAISTGPEHSLALKHDGTVVGWGSNYHGQLNLPPGLGGVKAVSAGSNHSALLLGAHSDFATRAVASQGTVKRYVVRNGGSQPLHITGVNVAGDQASDFTVDTSGMLTTVAPGGGSTTFKVRFTPGATGFRSTTLTILSDDPADPEFQIRLTGTGVIPATPREAWRLGHFGAGANAGTAADDADPNGNGISNLLEYALGGDPLGTSSGSSILPRHGISEAGTMEFKFTRNPARADIVMTIQASDDLKTEWTDLARSSSGAAFLPLVEGVIVTEPEAGPGEVREVTLRDTAVVTDPSKPRRFLRLVVSEP